MTVPPLGTYGALCAEIADWLNRASVNDATNPDVVVNRPNLGPVAPTFIKLAETQMRRRLDTRQMTTTVSIPLDSNGGIDLPCDFGGLDAITLGDYRYGPLLPVSSQQLAEQNQYAYSYWGRPRYYAITGTRIDIAPGAAYQAVQSPLLLKISYRRILSALGPTNPWNWMLRENPDVYLYGSLAQSAPYLQADDRVDMWAGLFTAALADVGVEQLRQTDPPKPRMTAGMIV